MSARKRRGGSEIERLVAAINVDRSGGLRKPHKPLLLLFAIARLVERGERDLRFVAIEHELKELIAEFAPAANQVRPGYPWWRLQADGLWEIAGASRIATNASGDPSVLELRGTTGRFPAAVQRALERDPTLRERVVQRLLDDHFPPTQHAQVLAAAGFGSELRDDGATTLREPFAADALPERVTYERWRRAAGFRASVLCAYGGRCALTGFHAEVAGVSRGVEAAHVQWHAKGGPARVANGIALQSTLHQLLDCGAFSLTDDRRVLVSSHFTGSPTANGLLPLNGTRLRDPLPGFESVQVDYIRWHREKTLGGVFKGPPLGA